MSCAPINLPPAIAIAADWAIVHDPAPSLSMLRNVDQTVSLSWRGVGTLEASERLAPSNWQPASSQANPQVIDATSATRSYRLKAESDPLPPSIAVQPRSTRAILGEAVLFSVTAFGSSPLSYQWRKDGQDISGADQSSYFIAAVQPSHVGAYTVRVTNEYGAETSHEAHLTVSDPPPPSIVVQPRSKAVILGASVTLSVTAVGAMPLSYQWRKDGQDISGATQATYSIGAVQSNHLGDYTVTVTNQYGAETSQVARLTQFIAGCPTSQYRFEEGEADQPATGDGSIIDFVNRSADGTPNGGPVYRADVGWPRVAACQCESNTRSLELLQGQSVKIYSPFIFHDQYGDATLEFLVKPAEQGHAGLFWTRPDNDDRDRFNIAINFNGGFGFDYRAPSGELHAGDAGNTLFYIPVDAWTHIAIVRDTQSFAPAHSYDFYVNGFYTTTAVDEDPHLPTSDQPWQISGRAGFLFTGSVDEIRFSARKLTPEEFLISEEICTREAQSRENQTNREHARPLT